MIAYLVAYDGKSELGQWECISPCHLLNVLEELVLFASIRAAERWLDPSEKAATLQLRISL